MNRKILAAKIILVFLSFFASTGFWWSASLLIENFPLTVTNLVILGITSFTALILTMSFSSLSAYLFSNKYLQIVLAFIVVVPMVLLINQLFVYFPALLVAGLLVYYFIKKIHAKAHLFTELNIGDIFEDYLQHLFMLLVTLLSVGLGLYSIQFTPERIALPRQVTNRVVEDVFVGLGMGGNVLLLDEEAFKKEARSILESSEGLTEEEKKSLLRPDSEIMDELVDERSIPGLTPDGVRLVIEQQINNLVQPFLRYIPLLFGIALFIILRIFSAPVVMLAILGVELTVKALLNFGVLHVRKEQIEAERLDF